MRKERIAKKPAPRRRRTDGESLRQTPSPRPDTSSASDLVAQIDAILQQVSPS